MLFSNKANNYAFFQKEKYHKSYSTMQRFYATVILIITTLFAQAQINEVPLQHNNVLQKHQAEKQHQIQTMLQKRLANSNIPTAATRDLFLALGSCVEADSVHLTCIDTTGLGGATTISILSISPINLGTTTLDTNNCVVYTADSNVDFGIDSIYVEVCGSINSTCDTTIYPIYVHRANNTITLPPNVINAEDTITVCTNSSALPSNFSSATILSNNTILGDAFPFGDCIFYEANRFAGTDTVVFQICDDFCVCDTYEMLFVVQQDTLTLPFMDDFSYSGPFPNDNWLNKNVYVNNDMALDPVSIGVATFDGLNEGGAPYGGGFGVSDDLTSAYLDLSPYTSASNVFLSFYVEPMGRGEAPAGNDSLILEFKNLNDEWNLIDTFKYQSIPAANDTIFIRDTMFNSTNPIVIDTIFIDTFPFTFPKFTFFSYHINENQYLFDGFQFRFRNFSGRTGNIDHWHLDYVRLVNNTDDDSFIQDIAFTEDPNPILKNYTSMPWWHFIDDVDGEIEEDSFFVETHLYNHWEATNTAQSAVIDLEELQTGTNVLSNLGILDGNEADIPPGTYGLIFPTIAPAAYPTFQSAMQNDFPASLKFLEFEKTYSFNVGEENANVNPIVEDNNVVTQTTIFDNYFAYDDGTAENGLEATTDNVQIALRFHSNVNDTLKAVQFHFPHISANTSSQLFTLSVWVGELDDTPEYEGILQKPLYIDSFLDSLNGFTTYVLKDIISGERTPLFIPAGDFYVGWKQVSICDLNECIAVGVDKNNPDGMENVFVDAFGFGLEWKNVLDQNPTLSGSLMIRPVVGEGEPQQSSSTNELSNPTQLSIYPNPTYGLLNIDLEEGNYNQFSYSIFDAIGKRLSTNVLTNELNISHLQNGIYFIKITNNKTNEIINRKVILAK